MKVRISKSYFFRQIPTRWRICFTAGEDVPDYFEFDGEEITDKVHPFLLKYPEARTMFSRTQLLILQELYHKPHGVSTLMLSKFSNAQRRDGDLSNAVDVHIQNIRKRIEKNGLPFRVTTRRPYTRILKELL